LKPEVLLRVHSHPLVQVTGSEKKIYTFFSTQDVMSLLGGSSPLLGMVSDRLWIIGKTAEAQTLLKSETEKHNLSLDLSEVTRAEIAGDERKFLDLAAATLSKYELAGYLAPIGGKIARIS